jgi:hypothetical protein
MQQRTFIRSAPVIRPTGSIDHPPPIDNALSGSKTVARKNQFSEPIQSDLARPVRRAKMYRSACRANHRY